MNAIIATNYFFKNQKSFSRGKVRDIYNIKDQFLVLVACDRISAFDHVLPKPIPFKGQVLNQVAEFFLKATASEVPNWFIASPDPNVTVGLKCQAIPIEMVIRGYLAGHAWRLYRDGIREICGVKLPKGLREYDPLPEPIITPTIKAVSGHDEDISMTDIIDRKLARKKELDAMEAYTKHLYKIGSKMANERGLILADSKYEFGLNADKKVILIDEVHTPDSSRYFYREGFENRQKKGEPQIQLSKEFVRQWLIENGFQGEKDQKIPDMSTEFIDTVGNRYIQLFEIITGQPFDRHDNENIDARIEVNITEYLELNPIFQ